MSPSSPNRAQVCVSDSLLKSTSLTLHGFRDDRLLHAVGQHCHIMRNSFSLGVSTNSVTLHVLPTRLLNLAILRGARRLQTPK
ncbi:hypothetical protein HZ326_20178 [Fusarium oxysporum f. sp. albedinis]|nr:hypothetical protein HZ326_20178 [Fusarium oxysporum f. sp. albedinis]